MATRGFENWTDADVVAHVARIRRGRTEPDRDSTNGASGIPSAQNEPDTLKSTASGLLGLSQTVAISDKRHKYRAEPCIVTADFTLFTTSDLQQLAYVNGRPDRARQCGSLRVRAAQLGIVGEWFGSTKEGRRYIALRQMETAGLIKDLRRQVPFALHVMPSPEPREGETLDCQTPSLLGHYVCDFVYGERVPAENMARVEWREIYEDVKGGKATATALYRWKRKHLMAQYGIELTER